MRTRKRVRTPKSGTWGLNLVGAAISISSAITTSNDQRRSFTIMEASKEISKISAIFDDFELYDFATHFLKDKDNREIFMGIAIERKVWWLRNIFDKNIS
ncbi:hypothetical protein M5K25_002625 [Dendrobium thyrsiflorum]|uniref:Uncharacterized protein n=1 Tax=Dendrobium thyrsiflorum TaxID=117978 RepID=A0ABD0VVM3_DENTH